MKKNILFSAALMFLSLASSAQTTITFDTEDYKSISVYDNGRRALSAKVFSPEMQELLTIPTSL